MSEVGNAEIMIGQGDWERFLSSMERLMSLHEKTLQRQRELNTRNESLRNELREAMGRPSTPRATGWVREVGGSGLVERLREWLKSVPASPPAYPIQYTKIRCGDCGYEVAKPTMFCEQCGVSFGGLYCRCGRQLLPGDRYCDNCGQSTSNQMQTR